MAKKDLKLDSGFEEVPLDEGFEEASLNPSMSDLLLQKAQDVGSSVKRGVTNLGQGIVEGGSDLATGVGQGLTMGFSDEALAGLKAGSDVALGDKSNFKDLYRKYQEIEQQKINAAEERSPWLSTIGEIGGAIAPALVTGGLAAPSIAKVGLKKILQEQGKAAALKELAKRTGKAALLGAPAGAVYGAGKSEGKLIGATPEEKEKLLKDTAEGTLTGSVVGATLKAATQVIPAVGGVIIDKVKPKMAAFIEDSPFFRQAIKAKKLGEEGVDIYSDKAKFGSSDALIPGQEGPLQRPGLLHADTDASRDLVDRIYKVDSQLGQNVGKVINDATDSGQIVNMGEELMGMGQQFIDAAKKDATLAANPKAQKLYETLFQLKKTEMTPKELQSLRSEVVDFADAIRVKDPYISSLGYDFQRKIGNVLKEAVPEYRIAADRFESFRRLVPETIISGSTPVDISGVKLSNLKNQEGKLFDSAKKMIQGSQNPGFGSSKEAETFSNFVKGLKQFEGNEAQRVKQGLIKQENIPKMIDPQNANQSKAMEKLIREKADQSAMLQQAWRINPQEGFHTATKGALFGRGSMMNLANKYGLHKTTITAPIEVGKKLLNASEEQIRSIASKVTEVPGLENLGKALLKGLENKDQSAINAAIFSLMQNPLARIKIDGEQE